MWKVCILISTLVLFNSFCLFVQQACHSLPKLVHSMEIFSVWCMLECVKGFEGFVHDMKIDLLIN